LIKCGSWARAWRRVGSDRKGLRVQCSAHRESSTCDNGRRVYLVEIESLVVTTLRKHLDHRPSLLNTSRPIMRNASASVVRRATFSRGHRREAEIGRELAA